MYLLFDIGGTKMRLALSRDGKTFDEPKVVETPKNFDEGMKVFEEFISEIPESEKIKIVSGGIAGPLDKGRAMLTKSRNLPNWANKPLKKKIEDMTKAEVFVENDTAMVGLGEMHFGAGREVKIGAYITVSTGVGGARFVDGKIDKNRFGFEPGHQIVDIEESGEPLDLEDLISGTALEKRTGKKAKEVTDIKIWNELAQNLAYGLYNIILQWSPDIVVLGGAMITGNPAISIEKTKEYLKKIESIFPELPEIKKAELGDFGGLHGALAFIKQQKELE